MSLTPEQLAEIFHNASNGMYGEDGQNSVIMELTGEIRRLQNILFRLGVCSHCDGTGNEPNDSKTCHVCQGGGFSR